MTGWLIHFAARISGFSSMAEEDKYTAHQQAYDKIAWREGGGVSRVVDLELAAGPDWHAPLA